MSHFPSIAMTGKFSSVSRNKEALVRRTIVQGTPTEAAEDQLRELQRALRSMTEQRQRMSAGETQRKMRGRRM